jgi:transposase
LSQRVEIITGTERRRRWNEEDKRRFVAEAFAPGAVVAHVARRHGVAESCLYAWRKRFGANDDRMGNGPRDTTRLDHPRLIPIMVEPASTMASGPSPGPALPLSGNAIITWPDGTRVEVEPAYPAGALRALIAALRPKR